MTGVVVFLCYLLFLRMYEYYSAVKILSIYRIEKHRFIWYYLVMTDLNRNEIFKSLRFIGEILSGIKYRKRRFTPANCLGMVLKIYENPPALITMRCETQLAIVVQTANIIIGEKQ